MKSMNSKRLSTIALLAALQIGGNLRAQIFVTNSGNNTIGEYNLDGSVVNASLVSSGLFAPEGVAVSGSDLFVTSFDGETLGEYTTSGATVNASLVSFTSFPVGVAVS